MKLCNVLREDGKGLKKVKGSDAFVVIREGGNNTSLYPANGTRKDRFTVPNRRVKNVTSLGAEVVMVTADRHVNRTCRVLGYADRLRLIAIGSNNCRVAPMAVGDEEVASFLVPTDSVHDRSQPVKGSVEPPDEDDVPEDSDADVEPDADDVEDADA